jgi:hypothetical protein
MSFELFPLEDFKIRGRNYGKEQADQRTEP